jgi:LacI family transcriptional regulator
MRKVAERADVAISSVSRVLSGHPDVSEAMRARVMSAVAELEYEPDFLAQSLRRGQTLSAGFVLGDISNPLTAQMVLGAETELRHSGYSLLLMSSENQAELDARSVRFFGTRRVDGMILSIVDETNERLLEALRQVKVPVVLIDRAIAEDIAASSVVADHRSGMREAAEHLVALGHQRIALIGGSRGTLPAREREAALQEAIDGAPQPVETRVLDGPYSPDHGATATTALLDLETPPTAIICGSNQVLVGCLQVLNARGVRVGRDLSLITCDDVPASQVFAPALASISRDVVGMGRTAAELLLRRITDEDEPEHVVLPTAFTARESCAPPEG